MKRTRAGMLGVTMCVAAFAVAWLLAPATAVALVQRTGNTVVVSDTIDDDLYAFGNTVEVPGDVSGDVVAFGQNVTISGDVSGDVITAGQNVRVTGRVGGTIRAAGSDVEISGPVTHDILAAGQTVRITSGGSAGRDAAVAGNVVTVEGTIGRNVLASAQTVQIASKVGGDVSAQAGNITVAQGAEVAGNLTYWSDNKASVSGTVRGTVTRHPAPQPQNKRGSGSAAGIFLLAALGWIRSLIGIALFGLLFVLLAKGLAERSVETTLARPWPSLGIGFATLAAAFPAAVLVFVLGLLVGGWWIAFVLLTLVWLIALGGFVTGATALGKLLLDRMRGASTHPLLSMLPGVAIIWVVGLIPLIGWLGGFAALLFGTGAVVLSIWGRGAEPPAAAGMPLAPPPPEPVMMAGSTTEPGPGGPAQP
jgi:cytoskeletal protein CcmA (bactofilin family)